jgi:hypothetical protein
VRGRVAEDCLGDRCTVEFFVDALGTRTKALRVQANQHNLEKAMHRVLCAMATLLAAGAAFPAAVDQENLPDVLQFNAATPSLRWQQEVVVGVDGRLSAIGLWSGEESTVFRLSINRGSGWQSDADDYSMVVSTIPYAEYTFNVAHAGLDFTVGDHFVIGIQGQMSVGGGNLRGSTGNAYGAGALLLDGAVLDPDYDMAFRTYVAAVPEPSAFALWAVGLLAVVLNRRRDGKRRR